MGAYLGQTLVQSLQRSKVEVTGEESQAPDLTLLEVKMTMPNPFTGEMVTSDGHIVMVREEGFWRIDEDASQQMNR